MKKITGFFICIILLITPINVLGNTNIKKISNVDFNNIENSDNDWWPNNYNLPYFFKDLKFQQKDIPNKRVKSIHLENGSTEVVSYESDGDSQASSIAIDYEGTIHVTWCDTAEYENASDGGFYDIFYKNKPKGGEWSAAEVVTPERIFLNNVASFIDVDSYGNVHVVWWIAKNDDNYHPICYKMKPKDGEWSATEFIPTNSVANCDVHIDVDLEDTVHVAWMGMVSNSSEYLDIFYNKKPYNDTWSTSEMISTEKGYCWFPHVAGGPDGSAHVAWTDNTNYQNSGIDFDMFYKMKPKYGEWSAIEVVSTDSLGHCGMSHIAIGSDGNVHVSWCEFNILQTSSKMYYRMKPNGSSWLEKEEITEECMAYTPWLFVDDFGIVHFVFDNMGSESYTTQFSMVILYRRKSVDGSWSRAEVISLESMVSDIGGSAIPRIAVDNNNLHFVWTDATDLSGCGEDMDIFYKMKSIIDNQHPEKPTISGPRLVKYDSEVDFTFYSMDLEGDNLYYFLWLHTNIGLIESWVSTWIGPYKTGEKQKVTIPHFLSPGISWIKAKAVDVNGGISDLEAFSIIVYRDKTIVFSPLLRFIEQYPLIIRILNNILGWII